MSTLAAQLRDVLALTKPRVTALVLCTTAGGIWLAPSSPPLAAVLLVLCATAMTVGAANTLNCYLEREVDGLMVRTAGRPLPAGRLAPRVALAFGLALALVSVPVLFFAVNPLTGTLGAVALACYVLAYTPLKLRSPLALPVGAIPGALPPLMGWTAVTGSLDAPGLALFAILFFWQIPHFLAIALYRKDDYARAGFKTVPVTHGDRAARAHLFLWTAVLAPTALSPYLLGTAGQAYLLTAVVLGAALVALAAQGLSRAAGAAWARRFFFATIAYLAVLFTVLLIDAGPPG